MPWMGLIDQLLHD